MKSTDTEAAGARVLPHLAPNTTVLCPQNDVDTAFRLRTVLPNHTVAAAVVYAATEMVDPGHVKHHGRGGLVVEPSDTHVAPALVAAGIAAEVSDDVRGALWLKLILNCAYNAVSAISQLPYGKTAVGGDGCVMWWPNAWRWPKQRADRWRAT